MPSRRYRNRYYDNMGGNDAMGYVGGGTDRTIVGLDQIVGNRVAVGARGRGNRARAAAMRDARAIDPDAVEVREDREDERRRLVTGFPEKAIAAGETEEVEVKPQELFRPERLIIPSSIGEGLVITQVNVGQRSQLVSQGELPAEMFSEVAVDAYVHWDTANVGNTITLNVKNTTSASKTFRGGLLGTAIL